MADCSLKPIPCMNDERAKLCPTQCFAMVSKRGGIDQEPQPVTYRLLPTRSTEHATGLIVTSRNRVMKNYRRLLYVGLLDLGYPTMLLAVNKTPRKVPLRGYLCRLILSKPDSLNPDVLAPLISF